MPFSYHSHSGQFCAHATNTLEEMVTRAIDRGMQTFGLSEHIPRDNQDLYPEEQDIGGFQGLERQFHAFYAEAIRLQEKYKDQIELLVGFETEWIRHSSLGLVNTLLENYKFDFFVGSVHHVHTSPIDFDAATYAKAIEIASNDEEQLFEDYFDSQYEMLQALQPPIVGHFDLIRLKSSNPERDWTTLPSVWAKIQRNLAFIGRYGGILELNSSAIRKGMTEPYPKLEICLVCLRLA